MKITLGLIALAVGILILFLTKSITLIADGNIKQVKIATKSLLGASNNAYAFHDIKEIIIEEDRQYERDSDGDRQDKTSFVLIFNFHNGYQEAHNLPPGSSSNIAVDGVNMSRFSQNIALMNIGQRVSEVIGVPFNYKRRGDMDLGDVVYSVGEVVRHVKQVSRDDRNRPQV